MEASGAVLLVKVCTAILSRSKLSRYVHGQRVAIPRIGDNPPHLFGEIRELQILDFNKHASLSEDEKRNSPSFDHSKARLSRFLRSLDRHLSAVGRIDRYLEVRIARIQGLWLTRNELWAFRWVSSPL